MVRIFAPIKERIVYFIDSKGITKEKFYLLTGISSSNFKGVGAKSEIGGDKIAKILSIFPEINPTWLITGEGKMIVNDTVNKDPPIKECGNCAVLEERLKEKEREIADLRATIEDKNEIIKMLKRQAGATDKTQSSKKKTA